ncbi:hypothetical protein ACFU5N_08375, partial [Streptomyces albidoflavus]
RGSPRVPGRPRPLAAPCRVGAGRSGHLQSIVLPLSSAEVGEVVTMVALVVIGVAVLIAVILLSGGGSSGGGRNSGSGWSDGGGCGSGT